MRTLLSISTHRYSKVIAAILHEYGTNAVVRIDGKTYSGAEIARLKANWCTNSAILRTRRFALTHNGAALFGFHDHPDELWAAPSERQFVERLHRDGLASFRELPFSPGRLRWLWDELKRLFCV